MASSALDIITGALLNINAYANGETLAQQDANSALNVLNDLLDSLSTDKCFVYTQIETIVPWVPGKFQYSVGNYVGGTFTGYTTTGSPYITGAAVPAVIIANGDLTDIQAAVPAGTTVVSYSSGNNAVAITFTAPPTGSSATLNANWTSPSGLYLITFSDGELRSGNFVNGATSCTWSPALIGTPTTSASVNINYVKMSANATQTLTAADTFTYTIPGDIKMTRPLRFNNSFTRATTSAFANLDYAFEFVSFDRYKEQLLKNIQGPWPYIAAYQPTFPLGTLYVYPAPGSSYTAHLFSDLILSEFANTTSVYTLPQGYTRALKKLLALELAPNYGKVPHPLLITQAKEAKELLKTLNDSPVVALKFDSAIARSQSADAGWIIHGGFN